MKSIKAFLCFTVFGYWLICSACANESKPIVETQKKSTPQNENLNRRATASKKENNLKEINPKKTNSQKKETQNSSEASSKKNKKTNSLKNKTNKQKPARNQNKATSTKQQTTKTASPKNVVSNSKKSEKERLAALNSFDNRVSNQADYAMLKKLVQDENESLKIRQEALKKIYTLSGQDEEMLDYLFEELAGKKQGFKKDVLYALQTFKYSSNLFQKKQADFLNALKTGLYNTKDKKTYHMLLKALADANDPAAHQTVIDFLKQEDFSMLSSKQLLQFLKKNVRPQHYASLHRIMQKTSNVEIKTQLIPLLIQHPNSKAKFVQYLGDKTQDIKTRLTCVDVLMEHEKPAFYTYSKNIIWDKEDNIKLRRHCLNLVNEVDENTLINYSSLKDDLLSIGISDNVLNELREVLLKKLP